MAARKNTENKKKLRRQVRAKTFQASKRTCRPPVRFCLMAKPAGPACNLRCAYCFYLEKEALFADGQNLRMSEKVLDAYVRKYIESQPSDEVAFHWQGGEPTLMGLEFFGKVIRLQRQYALGKRITNCIQTNGTLLDDEWGRFLHKHGFLVGISLDGPREVHNTHRLDVHGEGSFDAVMRGLEVLKRHRVEFNVLAGVTSASTDHPLEVYGFLKDAGVKFVQFIGIVERMPDDAAEKLGLQLAVGIHPGDYAETVRMTPWSVQPEAYGDFLIRIFDEWARHDVGSFIVMNFEWALSAYMGRSALVCQFMPQCGMAPIIEHNGDVYACDHYVYPRYRLGNILTDDLQEMMQSDQQREFGQAKRKTLPEYCRNCPVLPACWGECPKRRFLATPDGEPGLNYLCAGYRKFLTHATPYFEAMSRFIRENENRGRRSC